MAKGDEFDRGGASLDEVLGLLIEAQTKQTGLMTELVNVSKSLARSESREAVAEMIKAVAESTRTDMLAALVDAGASNGVAAPRQASQTPPPPPTVSDEVLDVLAQYDGLRAALARDGATNFYVAVTAERTAVSQTLTIQGTATKKADRVAIGGKYPDTWSRPDENTILVTNPPDEVFTGQPAIELWAGHRLVGAARFINVKSSTL